MVDAASYKNMLLEDKLNRKEELIDQLEALMDSESRKLAKMVEVLTRERDDLLRENQKLKVENMEVRSNREDARFELRLGQYYTRPPADEAPIPAPSARESQLESENEQLRREIQTLKAQLRDVREGGDEVDADMEQSFIARIENKPILALVWRLMQLDGARKEKRGDVKNINQILQMITGFPYDSCKKVWEVGTRPITRKVEDINKLNTLMKSIGMSMQL